jgi:hypothetical protein
MCETCEQYEGMLRLFFDVAAETRREPGPRKHVHRKKSRALGFVNKYLCGSTAVSGKGWRTKIRGGDQARIVLYLRYVKRMSLTEIGRKLGLSGERIRSVIERRIRWLRHPSYLTPFRAALVKDLEEVVSEVKRTDGRLETPVRA